MGDTDKSPSLTRLLGVSTPPLPLPPFGLLSAARPMMPSNKLPQGEDDDDDDDMLMLLLPLLVRSLHVVTAAVLAVAAGHADGGRNALQPWMVASTARGTRRDPW